MGPKALWIILPGSIEGLGTCMSVVFLRTLFSFSFEVMNDHIFGEKNCQGASSLFNFLFLNVFNKIIFD